MHKQKFLSPFFKIDSISWFLSKNRGYSMAPEVSKEYNRSKMLAWQIHCYGGLEELKLSKTVRVPYIKGPNDVMIQISASSVNPIDVLMMGGYGSVFLNKARQVEACSFSEILEFPLVLGRDFAGRVVAKGLGVGHDVSIGDEVWGALPPHQQGCHAEFVRVNKSLVHRKPRTLSLLESASIPYAAMTAWSALKVTGGLCLSPPKGKRVLILGGSGGVGTAALQLLKAWGAQVVTTCRADAVPLLESFGADCVIDYTHTDAEKQIREEGKYNIILDAAGLGADAGPKYADCLKDINISKFITLRSPLLRNVDDYGVVAGTMKNIADLFVTNVKTGIMSKSSTVRWGFFLPLSDAIREITTLVEEGKMCPAIEK
ncbi:reticulon-4-interacting protein 1 homolog, mitochondrial isoform X2 [Zootermopsis nevadensis]|nr:reticulon-4-interacting protein 1 homolog, mitochondrial isoform X2 [Zootermopsis nevadensis]